MRKLFIFVFLFVSLLTFQTVSAQDISSLQKQIEELTKLVNQIRLQLEGGRANKPINFIGPPVVNVPPMGVVVFPSTGTTEGNPPQTVPPSFGGTSAGSPPVTEMPKEWCHTFGNNLSLGSRGGEVAFLQKVLEKEGFVIASEEKNTQYFGESTAAAVSGFQEKYRSEILDPLGFKYPTGFVGKLTRAKLNALYGCSITPPGIPPKTVPPVTKVCPQDAKLCSDGTYVGRTGPNCEFICPGEILPPITENKPPVIIGVGGPTTLQVNYQGTWTVKAYDPENGVLKYSVIWGDETPRAETGAQPFSSSPFQQTTTFSHSYSKAGIYNPTFIVTDDKGLSAKTSTTVNVGGVSQPSITVLSPNEGETWQVGQTYEIRWNQKQNTLVSISIINRKLPPLFSESDTGSFLYSIISEFKGVAGENRMKWVVPSSLPPSAGYQVCVGGYFDSGYERPTLEEDCSDAPFSIISSTASQSLGPTSPSSQMANTLEAAKALLLDLLKLFR